MNQYTISKGINREGLNREEVAIIQHLGFWYSPYFIVPEKIWKDIGKLMGWKM